MGLWGYQADLPSQLSIPVARSFSGRFRVYDTLTRTGIGDHDIFAELRLYELGVLGVGFRARKGACRKGS